jgi:hypothetical protein
VVAVARPHRSPAGLGELDPTRHTAGLGCRPREAAVAWPPASSGFRVGGGGGQRRAAAPEGRALPRDQDSGVERPAVGQ